MKKIGRVFTEKEIKVLESNPSVLRVSENITYSPAFKIAAVQANQAGHTPMEIFVQTGFYLELIGQETPKRCLERWRKTYASSGEAGLLEERRGREAQKDRLVVSYRLRKSSVLPRLVSSFWKPRMNS